jgi:glycosyltransferase involved in cell wall biosynthesis
MEYVGLDSSTVSFWAFCERTWDDSWIGMKILYVITSGKLGGAQRYVAALANDQKRRGNDVRVVCGVDGNWLEGELEMSLERVPLKRSWNVRQSAYKRALKDVFSEFVPDIVHFHSSHAMLGLDVVKKFPEVRSLITIHGLSLYHQKGLGTYIYRRFLRKAVRLADHVSFVCKADRRVLLEEGRLHNKVTSVVYPGISELTYLSRGEARKQLGLNRSDRVVGMIGRFATQKNQQLLIDAFLRLDKEDLKLVLIGTGQAPEAHDDRVLIVQGGPELLSAFDVFVNSALYEGFPYVLLEAGLAGLSVVATDVGGVSELVEDGVTGLLSSFDSNKMASKICTAFEHPEFGLALRQRVEEDFSCERMLEAMNEVYKKTA